jgi:hypothetical protein
MLSCKSTGNRASTANPDNDKMLFREGLYSTFMLLATASFKIHKIIKTVIRRKDITKIRRIKPDGFLVQLSLNLIKAIILEIIVIIIDIRATVFPRRIITTWKSGKTLVNDGRDKRIIENNDASKEICIAIDPTAS